MKTETHRKYPRLSPRSLLLYEMAKRRAERIHEALDSPSSCVGSNLSQAPASPEGDRSAGLNGSQ